MSISLRFLGSGLFAFLIAFLPGFGSQAEAATVELVTNGGFESPELIAQASTFPTITNNWIGDIAAIAISPDTNGIIPFEGEGMLRFKGSSGTDSNRFFMDSDVFQLIDVTPFRSTLDAGAAISATGVFNRVVGDTQTDTQFNISLLAYAGAPYSFPNQFRSHQALAQTSVELESDANIATWERLSAKLSIPKETDFVALRITASENVFNDLSGIEFDGHYADAVELNIGQVPEPLTILGTAAALGFGFCLRRRSSSSTR